MRDEVDKGAGMARRRHVPIARRRRVPLLMFAVVVRPKMSAVPVMEVAELMLAMVAEVEPVKVFVRAKAELAETKPTIGS